MSQEHLLKKTRLCGGPALNAPGQLKETFYPSVVSVFQRFCSFAMRQRDAVRALSRFCPPTQRLERVAL